jgi:hypothetical protein
MALTIDKNISASYAEQKTTISPWKRFITWADKQEEHRFGWTAFTIAGHGCVFTILTLVAILVSGNNFIFWPFAIVAMAVPLIANLAALPTRITIPILLVSILVDVAIIISAFVHGIDSSILNS